MLAIVALVAARVPAALSTPSGCPAGTLGRAAVNSLSDRTDVLFIGSSHVLLGIRPQQYTVRAMNLATTWLDYTCAKRIVEKQLHRVPNLKVAVIEYDELPFVSDLVPAAINARDLRALTELSLTPLEFPTVNVFQKIDAVYTEFLFQMTGLPRVTPLGWTTRTQSCADLQHPLKNFAAGYYYTETVTPPTYDAKPVYAALAKCARDERVVQRNLHALDGMVALLRQRGVAVVLLRLPHARDYDVHRPPVVAARWRELQSWAATENAADPGVHIWDLGNSPRFEPHDFCDNHHLNVFGANKLARLIDGDLRLLCAQVVR